MIETGSFLMVVEKNGNKNKQKKFKHLTDTYCRISQIIFMYVLQDMPSTITCISWL